MFQSGTGMLLHLVKHSRLIIEIIIRVLLMVNDGVSKAAFLEMHPAIKDVLDMINLGFKIELTGHEKEQ